MNEQLGVYEVTGRRVYRGHEPGTVFEARIDGTVAARAIKRGDITLLEYITPNLPAEWALPKGWTNAD